MLNTAEGLKFEGFFAGKKSGLFGRTQRGRGVPPPGVGVTDLMKWPGFVMFPLGHTSSSSRLEGELPMVAFASLGAGMSDPAAGGNS